LGEANPNFKHGNHCTDSLCECGKVKDYRAVKCSDCTNLHKPIEGYTRDIDGIIKAISNADSYLKASRLCGVNRARVREVAKENNIDISHFTVCKNRPSKAEDIFKIHDKRVNAKVRKYLLDNEILEYLCDFCGLNDEWNGNILTLELDHINGIREDNRLENLRFLCPNCHSQTSTYRGANNARK
jgi:Zn finger protein HypA/HybF involved in hydrogenase expression